MKKNIIFASILLFFVLIIPSKANSFFQNTVKTEVSNLTVSDISKTKAKLAFTICGQDITEIGICYGTSENATVSSGKSEKNYEGEAYDVSSKIDYKTRISGLDEGKEYYARAYVKNKAGKIFYSSEVKFKTEKEDDNFAAMLNGQRKEFYPNGVVMKEYSLKDGKVEGNMKFYNAEGVLVADEYIKNGIQNGTCKYYHKNGQLQREITLKDGIQNGSSKEYDEDGNLTLESNMFLGSESFKFTGDVKHFNKDGQMIEHTTFSNGKLSYSIHKDSQGRTTSEESEDSSISYSYDSDGWKHTSYNGEKCTCSKCSDNSSE